MEEGLGPTLFEVDRMRFHHRYVVLLYMRKEETVAWRWSTERNTLEWENRHREWFSIQATISEQDCDSVYKSWLATLIVGELGWESRERV